MNKKVWIGFITVYITMAVTNMVIHVVLLGSTYHLPEVMKIMRPESEAMTWVHFVTAGIMSFFFALIFSKGYEGKGMAEGVRFGLYTGLLMATPMAYDSYAVYPVPYSLALQWFCYGVIQYVILGVVIAMVFGKSNDAPAVTGSKS